MPADTAAIAVVEPILEASITHAIGTAAPIISDGSDGATAVLTSLPVQHSAVDGMMCSIDLQLHPILLNLASVAHVTLLLLVNRAPAVHITIVVALSVIAHSTPSATVASTHESPDCTTDNTTILSLIHI